MADKFQLVVIGAGPGGYVAAIRAAQLGLKTAIVEKEYLGGVCLNWGCIPSKTLLYVTELKRTVEHAQRIGLKAEKVDIDLEKMLKHKDDTVKRLTGGVKILLDKAGVKIFNGTASFASANEIVIEGEGEKQKVEADNFIIATGTSPIDLPVIPADGHVVIGAREAINVPRIPKEMLVIGAGPIGVEMATVYNTLGARVTIVEVLDSVLPTLDSDISSASERALKKQGMEIMLSSRVVSSKKSGKDKVNVVIETKDGNKNLAFDMVLVAAGMKPNLKGLNLEKTGVETDEHGFIKTDKFRRTNVANIFAIGDVAGGLLLAHKASHEGHVAVQTIAGGGESADWKGVPYAVFTDPEIAGIGMTEQEAKKANKNIKVGKFPYRAVGKALATLASDGFVKIIADADSDALLGIHIFGPHSGDIIYTGTAVMEMDGTTEDLASIMAVHPTLSEAVMEAALNADKRAIHIIN